MPAETDRPSTMTDAFEILSAARRRYALYMLADNRVSNVDNLVVQIAEWERGTSVTAVSDEQKERIEISLVHNHLPRLADHDVVTYDPQSGDVVLAEGFSEIEPILDDVKRAEESVDEPGTPLHQLLAG